MGLGEGTRRVGGGGSRDSNGDGSLLIDCDTSLPGGSEGPLWTRLEGRLVGSGELSLLIRGGESLGANGRLSLDSDTARALSRDGIIVSGAETNLRVSSGQNVSVGSWQTRASTTFSLLPSSSSSGMGVDMVSSTSTVGVAVSSSCSKTDRHRLGGGGEPALGDGGASSGGRCRFLR